MRIFHKTFENLYNWSGRYADYLFDTVIDILENIGYNCHFKLNSDLNYGRKVIIDGLMFTIKVASITTYDDSHVEEYFISLWPNRGENVFVYPWIPDEYTDLENRDKLEKDLINYILTT